MRPADLGSAMASVDPLFLRFFERLIAVLIGGLAIYLGYRLFQKVPENRDSSGRVTLPWNVSIVMTRVGPGVFFALFGVSAVGLSLINPLQLSDGGGGKPGVIYAGEAPSGDPDGKKDARRLLRKEINILNAIPRRLTTDLPLQDREEVDSAIARIKLLLMKPVWGTREEGFGDFAEFETWVQRGEPDPAPPGMSGALELYRYGSGG
jgi:hypothetical protein